MTATGPDLAAARDRAYRAVSRIHLDGSHHRTDIAAGAAAEAAEAAETAETAEAAGAAES